MATLGYLITGILFVGLAVAAVWWFLRRQALRNK